MTPTADVMLQCISSSIKALRSSEGIERTTKDLTSWAEFFVFGRSFSWIQFGRLTGLAASLSLNIALHTRGEMLLLRYNAEWALILQLTSYVYFLVAILWFLATIAFYLHCWLSILINHILLATLWAPIYINERIERYVHWELVTACQDILPVPDFRVDPGGSDVQEALKTVALTGTDNELKSCASGGL